METLSRAPPVGEMSPRDQAVMNADAAEIIVDGARDAGSMSPILDMSLEAELPSLEEIEFEPTPVRNPRLTQAQIRNALKDVFGNDIVVPTMAEPDLAIGGFITVGAAVSSLSPRGVESVERMAYSVAEQVVAENGREERLGCSLSEDVCVSNLIRHWGRRLWRRSLSQDEASALLELYDVASQRLDDSGAGLEFMISALIQSPHFLFVRSIGEDGYYTSLEMASRLSLALWNTIPDELILSAGESGELMTDQGLNNAIDYLLMSPQSTGWLLTILYPVVQSVHVGSFEQGSGSVSRAEPRTRRHGTNRNPPQFRVYRL